MVINGVGIIIIRACKPKHKGSIVAGKGEMISSASIIYWCELFLSAQKQVSKYAVVPGVTPSHSAKEPIYTIIDLVKSTITHLYDDAT